MRIPNRLYTGVFLFCLVFAAAPAIAGDRRSDHADLYSGSQYLGWIDYLASNELEGRGTGQPGNDKAAEYIADVWTSFGIEPAGDDDTFFQNFGLPLDARIGSLTRLAIATDGRRTRKPARLNDEFVPLPFSASATFSGEVVFAGYGITGEDEDYDDYRGIDADGKVVLILRRGPGFADFGMGHVSFRAKARNAKEHGAAALLVVNRDGNSELYDFHRAGGPSGDHGLPMLHITPDLADRMLAAGGLPDIRSLQKKIEASHAPASAPLDGVSARGRADIEPIMTKVRNVVGMIPGTGPQSDEIIVLGAHYDHLGVRNKDKPDFDPEKDINNGADDNASGTAMLMQMARVFTEGGRPNRTLVLVAFTGEELGLLGSRHFARHPTVDLDKCIAMLNFDMVGRLKNNLLELGGMRTGGFEDMARDLGERYGFDIHDGGGGRGPSDHTNFYLRDIPVLFFFTGIHKQYHRPTDDTPLINADGAMRVARYATDILAAIDGNPEAPRFQKDTRRARVGRQGDRTPRKEQPKKEPQPEQIAKATPMEPAPLAGPRAEHGRAPSDEPSAAPGAPVRLGVIAAPDDGNGVLADDIDPESPADRAGVRPGDRIVRIGGRDVRYLDDAVDALAAFRVGDRTTIRIRRGDNQFDLAVQLGERAAAPTKQARTTSSRLDRALIDRIVRILERRDADGALSSMGLTHDARGFEVKAVIEPQQGGAALLGDLMIEFAEAVEAHARQAGAAYDFELGVDTKYLFGAKPSMTVSIRVTKGEPSASALSMAQATPHPMKPGRAARYPEGNDHGYGGGNGRASAQKDEVTEGKPRGPHDDVPNDVENNTMPPVRLGIMPTYGAPEGEGFEIAGVVEGGAAAKAGMKDHDRILSIRGKEVVDVYSYMDALRQCKPGQNIPVVVLRDGKRVELTIIAAEPEMKEAA